MMGTLAMMSEYQEPFNSRAVCSLTIPAEPTPFLPFEVWASFRRLIKIGRDVLMEVLGLDPYQSQTQYLEGFFRGIEGWKQSGNGVAALFPPCCHIVSTFPSFRKKSGNKEETKQQHVAASKPTIFNEDKD